MKNKSYIGISFIILVFGIWAVPKIVAKFQTPDLYVVGKAPEFKLKNQDQKLISNTDFKDKVTIVEFFFSTCPTICPIMNKNMKLLQDHFYANSNFAIASFTINPKNDTPQVLKEHAKIIGATHRNWHFLTGDQDAIFNVATKGFNLYVGENSKVSGGFEHSGLFAIIDKKGMIRCRKDQNGNPIIYYDGLEKKGVEMLKEDVAILLKE